MPRTVFALPVQEIPPTGASRETRLLFLTAYIRPENEFRNATSKSFIVDEWTELVQRPDIRNLVRKGRWVRDNAARVYDEWVSDLTNEESAYLRSTMLNALPFKYRQSFDPVVERYYQAIERSLQTGENQDKQRVADARKNIMIEPFSMKVERARGATLQKWMQYHEQGIGICYSVVTPRLDEMRCVREDKNAVNTRTSADPLNMRIKHGRQPFAVDLHTAQVKDLRTPTISNETASDLDVASFSNIFQVRPGGAAGVVHNIEKLRAIIKEAYETKVKDDKLRIGHIFTDFDVEITDPALQSFLSSFKIILQDNKVSLLMIEQFLQRFGFILDPENTDEWRRDEETGQPMGSKCKDYIRNGIGEATLGVLINEGSEQNVIEVLGSFKQRVENLKMQLPAGENRLSSRDRQSLENVELSRIWLPIVRSRAVYRRDQFQRFEEIRQDIINTINAEVTAEERARSVEISTGGQAPPEPPPTRRTSSRRGRRRDGKTA